MFTIQIFNRLVSMYNLETNLNKARKSAEPAHYDLYEFQFFIYFYDYLTFILFTFCESQMILNNYL